ncbi:LysM peptidoglycan-binding domain-containing protein [Pseudomonadota bacterium]
MDLQTIIRKLELNESTISTVLGGIVLLVVVFLMLNYFQTDRGQEIASKADDVKIEDTSFVDTPSGGQISAASVSRYTVKPGDYLWKIAVEKYGDGHKWVEIAETNDLADPDLIEVGDELDIPKLLSVDETSVGVSPTSVKPDNYMVKRGDYLWKLSVEFYGDGFRWVDVWRANQDQVKNPDMLLTGQLLTLPD